MKKYVILLMQEAKEELYHPPFSITDADQLVACNDDGEVLFFDSLEDADCYREDEAIDGQIVELPMY